jgi:hypothetical protein
LKGSFLNVTEGVRECGEKLMFFFLSCGLRMDEYNTMKKAAFVRRRKQEKLLMRVLFLTHNK